MKSVIFYNTLKSNRPDERFEAIRQTFLNCDAMRGYHNKLIPECDLAIIQGWIKKDSKGSHNEYRKRIIENQVAKGKHVLTIDGNIFNYLIKGVYFRYSIDGIFGNTGYYFDKTIDPNRWNEIKKRIGCDIKPWRKNGNHIVILMQKDSGWTMGDVSNVEWCSRVIDEIKKHTDRKIIIRIHPSDIKVQEKYKMLARNKSVTISNSTDIREDLRGAWCSISYNSSPGAVSAIEGVPVFIMDRDCRKSPAFQVGNTNISKIEDPLMPERKEWIQRIAMSHFSVEDIRKGLLWNGVKEYFNEKN